MQSERFYNALRGHGKTARLVMLQLESHGYAARESLLHMLGDGPLAGHPPSWKSQCASRRLTMSRYDEGLEDWKIGG
jgi:hypothetical protein